MPNDVTVYLMDKVEVLTIDEIRSGISVADWWTLAEEFGIEESEVDDFLANMKWSADPLQFHLYDRRPVQIEVCHEGGRVAEELAEAAEGSLPALVKAHLEQVKSVVILELGISQAKTMFEIVAYEIAYWLSESKRGVILSWDGFWYDYGDNRWRPIS
jgi:hypothetical protein